MEKEVIFERSEVRDQLGQLTEQLRIWKQEGLSFHPSGIIAKMLEIFSKQVMKQDYSQRADINKSNKLYNKKVIKVSNWWVCPLNYRKCYIYQCIRKMV